MKKETLLLMKDMELVQSATVDMISDVEKNINIQFPEQYKQFLLQSNGAEGAIGKNSYLALWSVDSLYQSNIDYCVEKFTPGLVYFGSDGGAMAYAFDVRKEQMKIVEIPFESIHIEDANVIADTFEDFLNVIYKR